MKLVPKIDTLLAVTLFLAGSFFWGAPSVGQDVVVPGITHSGAICRAANLNQALRGIGNNQRGVSNNSVTESFFVVCPHSWPAFGPGFLHDIIAIQPLFPIGGGEMTCVLRYQNIVTGAISAFLVSMTSTTQRPPPTVREFTPIDPFFNPNITLVCPLDPGEGLEWFEIL